MDRVSRKELAKAVSNKTGLSQTALLTVIDMLLYEIKNEAYKNKMIELRGFGTFYPVYKKPRTYTIARLKDKVEAKGKMTLRFKPSRQITIYEVE